MEEPAKYGTKGKENGAKKGKAAAAAISIILTEFKAKTCAGKECTGGWEFVSLPFVNRINDGIGFFVRRDEAKDVLCFTDGGDAVDLFTLRGRSIAAAEVIAKGYYGGVRVVDGELIAEAKAGEEGETAMGFLNALLELSFA